MICPLTSTDCDYCSQEKTTRPFTRLEKNTVTGMFVPIGLGKANIILGEICNNAPVGKSPWVKDQKECPKTFLPATMVIKKPVPGKVKVQCKRTAQAPAGRIKITAKQMQERTERELTKLRSPSPNVLVIPDSSKKSKKRPGQQTLGDVIEI